MTQVMTEARKDGTLLPEGHPAQARVERIGRRIQQVASNSANGGGFQDHMKVCLPALWRSPG